eukprot:scaffold693_cov200-Alexandrium_tamarense.AAC.32
MSTFDRAGDIIVTCRELSVAATRSVCCVCLASHAINADAVVTSCCGDNMISSDRCVYLPDDAFHRRRCTVSFCLFVSDTFVFLPPVQ